jgi:hypothetical protein
MANCHATPADITINPKSGKRHEEHGLHLPPLCAHLRLHSWVDIPCQSAVRHAPIAARCYAMPSAEYASQVTYKCAQPTPQP